MSGSKITKKCKYCGKEFDSYFCQKRSFCSIPCRCRFLNESRRKEKEKKECLVCHKLFEVTKVRTKYCSNQCKGFARRKPELERKQYIPKEPRIKQCAVCGADFIAHKAAKFCLSCRETERLKNARASWKTEKYRVAHLRAALAWQKNNPEKVKAQSLIKSHPERINIIYECSCLVESKEHHHPDYSKPYDVLKLCNECHEKEHARLRSLIASAVAIG